MSVSLLERQDKTSAKPEKIALPVTPLWRSHLLCEGECKERDWWLSQVNPQTPQGSFACFSLGCKGEFIRKVSVWRVLPTLLVSRLSPLYSFWGSWLSFPPHSDSYDSFAPRHLHLSSLSLILFLIFLSLDHSLYHRFLSCLLHLPSIPLPFSLRTFATPFPRYEPTFALFSSDPSIFSAWRFLLSSVPSCKGKWIIYFTN